MHPPTFHLEHWLAAWEHKAERVIGTSGIASLPLSDLGADLDLPTLLDYGEIPGEPALVAAIADWQGVTPDNVLLTIGGTEADFLVPFSLVSPGDVVLVESPTYPPLRLVPESLGARVERLPRLFEDEFRLEVDAACRRLRRGDVRLLSLTNPNNPTGQVLGRADLLALAEAADDGNAHVMVDEIFRDLAFEALPVAATLHPRLVSTSSLTKCYGLSGLRSGWILAAPALRDRFREAKALTSVVNPALEQHLALRAIAERDRLLARAKRIADENLGRLRKLVAARDDLAWVAPRAAPLSAPRLLRESDDVAFAEALLEERSTLLAPGSFLDLPGHVRIGFGSDPAAFADGLDRLRAFLDGRPPRGPRAPP